VFSFGFLQTIRMPASAAQQLFRTPPPLQLITEFLQDLGFQDITDTREFSLTDIELSTALAAERLPHLEPYYYPCKAAQYINKTQTPNTLLVIIRQLLRTQGYTFHTTEKKRQTMYRIMKESPNPEFLVSFT
jgi:hypothetical protein